MVKRLAGVAIAAVMACGWASGAEAYDLAGRITGLTGSADFSPTLFRVGDVIEINFDVYGFYPPQYKPGCTDLTNSLGNAYVNANGADSYFYNEYPDPSYIKNDGNTSSLLLNFGTTGQFYVRGAQSAAGLDGGIGVSVSSDKADIPLDPYQTFGPVSVSGSGSFGTFFLISGYDENDQPIYGGSYFVNFDIFAVSNGVSAVPLPASAPMFGAALLALAGIGYGARRKSAASHVS